MGQTSHIHINKFRWECVRFCRWSSRWGRIEAWEWQKAEFHSIRANVYRFGNGPIRYAAAGYKSFQWTRTESERPLSSDVAAGHRRFNLERGITECIFDLRCSGLSATLSMCLQHSGIWHSFRRSIRFQYVKVTEMKPSSAARKLLLSFI